MTSADVTVSGMATSGGTETDRLTVRFVHEERVIEPGDDLIFGRGAELDIDSNPFLHRRMGRFVCSDGMWWIENLSAWTPLSVAGGPAATSVAVDGRATLVHPENIISFEAGSCRYEIRALLGRSTALPRPDDDGFDDRTATIRATDLPLTDEQLLLVVALAEGRLRDPFSRRALPKNRNVAERLGWTLAKYNRKLDYLCQKLTRAGVKGLLATDGRSTDRRERVIDHLLSSGQLTFDDLELLKDLPSADRSSN